MVRKALRAMPELESDVNVKDDGSITVIRPEQLDRAAAKVVREATAAKARHDGARAEAAKRASATLRNHAREAWEKLWMPIGRRVSLVAVACDPAAEEPDGGDTTRPPSRASEDSGDHDDDSGEEEAPRVHARSGTPTQDEHRKDGMRRSTQDIGLAGPTFPTATPTHSHTPHATARHASTPAVRTGHTHGRTGERADETATAATQDVHAPPPDAGATTHPSDTEPERHTRDDDPRTMRQRLRR